MVSSGRWRQLNDDNFKTGAHAFVKPARSDSIMLEAIVLLLGVGTCALILIAFWGLDLLGMRRRRG
jgi:hypothetical protein